MNVFRALWEDFKAARRGEKRLTPRQVRGRVYARKDGGNGGPGRMAAAARPKPRIRRRVYRVATGQWEDLD